MEAVITLGLFLGIYEYISMVRISHFDYSGCTSFLHLMRTISPYELLRDYRYDSVVKYRSFKIIIRLLCTAVGFFGLVLCVVLHDIYYIYNNSQSYIDTLKIFDDDDEDGEGDPGYRHFVNSHKIKKVTIHKTGGGHYYVANKSSEEKDEQENEEDNSDEDDIDVDENKFHIAETDSKSCSDCDSVSWHNSTNCAMKTIKDSFSSDIACILIDENIDHAPIVNSIRNIGINNVYVAKYENSKLKTVERTYDIETRSVLYHILHTNIDDALFTFWCTLNKDIVNLNNKLVSTVIVSDGTNPKPSQFAHIRVFRNDLDTQSDLNAKVLAKLIDSTSKFDIQ